MYIAGRWRRPAGATAALIALLDHNDHDLAIYAAAALTWCGEAAAPAVPVLSRGLVDSSELLATVAAGALVRLQVRRKDAVTALVQRLSTAASAFRYTLILALRDIGPEAREAAPLLRVIALDESAKSLTRGAAAHALGSVAPKKQTRELLWLGCLSCADGLLVQGALDGLGISGGIPNDAIPVLRRYLASPALPLRQAAAHGLGQMQPAVSKSFDRLAKLGADPQLLLFHFAAQVIERESPIGLRRVSAILSAISEVESLGLPASEASLRAMFAALERGLGAPLSAQTTKGTGASGPAPE